MMCFELTQFYKRSAFFIYDTENNDIEYYNFNNTLINKNYVFQYSVERLDEYINTYDALPTVGPVLVSRKFKEVFHDLLGKEIDLYNAVIVDERSNRNTDFMVLKVLNAVSCLDERRSIIEKKYYDDSVDEDDYDLNIKKLYIKKEALLNFSIVLMKEKDSYILVTKEFKEKCENNKLNGFLYLPI